MFNCLLAFFVGIQLVLNFSVFLPLSSNFNLFSNFQLFINVFVGIQFIFHISNCVLAACNPTCSTLREVGGF